MTTPPQQDIDLEAQTRPHVSRFSSSSVISVVSLGVASDTPNPTGRASYEASSTMAATLSGGQLSEAPTESFLAGQQNEQPPTRESESLFQTSHGMTVDMRDAEGTGATPDNEDMLLANAATTQDQTTAQWNGQLSDWASWPIGRPGPFISDDAVKEFSSIIGDVTTEAEEGMKTDELVFHIAEFTQSGEGETLVVGSSQDSHQGL
jgi:hypothetical protein